jgi:myo-inositol catabolism protein IolC
MKKFEWSNNYQKCINCGTNRRPHSGGGVCSLCYQAYAREIKRKTTYEVINARNTITDKAKNAPKQRSLQFIYSIMGKAPNWWRVATDEEKNEWIKKTKEAGSKIIKGNCAKCGRIIMVMNKTRSFTFCKDCRRLAYNVSMRKYNLKKKTNAKGNLDNV